MGFRERDMYSHVRDVLRRRFPAWDGWEIYEQDHWGHYIPDFVVERVGSSGRIERVVVEVKDECSVSLSHIFQVNMYARNLAGNNVKIVGKILVYPSGVRGAWKAMIAGIEVIRLRSFVCE